MFTYKPEGTCSRLINLDIQDGVIRDCSFEGGCAGNVQGVAKLIVGRTPDEVIPLLKGIQCRGGTSCPDQLAKALEAYMTKRM